VPGLCPEGPRPALPRPFCGVTLGLTSTTALEPTWAFFHPFDALLGSCSLSEGGTWSPSHGFSLSGFRKPRGQEIIIPFPCPSLLLETEHERHPEQHRLQDTLRPDPAVPFQFHSCSLVSAFPIYPRPAIPRTSSGTGWVGSKRGLLVRENRAADCGRAAETPGGLSRGRAWGPCPLPGLTDPPHGSG